MGILSQSLRPAQISQYREEIKSLSEGKSSSDNEVIDTDGNGLLSYDEVLDICRKSLKRFTRNEDSSTKNLAEYFTTLVFRALERDFEE